MRSDEYFQLFPSVFLAYSTQFVLKKPSIRMLGFALAIFERMLFLYFLFISISSIKPYFFAVSASMKLSRSVSRSMFFRG